MNQHMTFGTGAVERYIRTVKKPYRYALWTLYPLPLLGLCIDMANGTFTTGWILTTLSTALALHTLVKHWRNKKKCST